MKMSQQYRINLLCKTNNIKVSRLERELSFSQNYLTKPRKQSYPADKLDMIAVFFGVPIYYLIYGNDKEEITKNFKTLKKLREEGTV